MTLACPLKPVSPCISTHIEEEPAKGGKLTLRTTVNERFETLWNVRVDEIDERRAHPPSSIHRVESTDDNVELHVIVVVLVLNFAIVSIGNSSSVPSLAMSRRGYVRDYSDTGNSLHDKLGSNSRFGLTNILAPTIPTLYQLLSFLSRIPLFPSTPST